MPRGKTPKIKVLSPKINILGLKNLCLLELALSVARKGYRATDCWQKSKLQSLLVSVGKDCTENEKSVPK